MLSAVGLLAQPAPDSVQNPGSNTLAGLPNYGIAQGSIFVVYGAGLGPATIMAAPSLPLQTTLGGTSVSVSIGGTTVSAYITYTLATQVAAVLPSNTPIGTGTVAVTYNGVTGNSTPIVVVASNFGILSVNETGTGPAVATHVNNTFVSVTNAANTSEEIVIWGTGLGPLANGVSDASAPGASGANIGTITVWVGGAQASVVYHGRNPYYPGMDQINVIIPGGVSGCYVSLAVQTGNTVSNTTTLAISAAGSTCSDANGLSPSSVYPTLNSTGTARIGFIGLDQASIATGSATFQKYTAGSASALPYPSIGSCTILILNSSAVTGSTIVATGLDAGSQLAVALPTGNVVDLTTSSIPEKGVYTGPLSSLPADTYQVTGTGGADVGAFTASFQVTAPLMWTNQGTVMANPINRSQPLTIAWTGGDPGGYALIEGIGSNGLSASNSIGAAFICIAPIGPGTFTVPASVLLSLPGGTNTSAGYLSVGSVGAQQTFTAPGLDAGYMSAASIAGGSVTWQ